MSGGSTPEEKKHLAETASASMTTSELLGKIYADSKLSERRNLQMLFWARVAAWAAVVALIVALAIWFGSD